MDHSTEIGSHASGSGNKTVPERPGHDREASVDSENSKRDDSEYPSTKVVVPAILAICLAFLLTALDRTIIGVSIPAISNEFHSFGDISWYEAAFLLTFCIFQLPMGKIYKFYSAKWTFVAIVVIFEAGSIVCATAPTSVAFIIGRAITGIGAAGTVTGAQVIIAGLLPLQKRPKYQGFLGAVFGISSLMGPLLGGAFTTDVTWRWCFWINLPIGGFALAALVFILPPLPPQDKLKGSVWENLKQFDPLGYALLAPGLICLILALQWGGTKYVWSDAKVIGLLAAGSCLLVLFGLVQLWVQENGTIPPRICRQRSIAAGIVVTIGNSSTLIISAFYLPIWFQAIRGISAGSAGVRLLPYYLSTVFSVIASGILISKFGYYTPWLNAGSAILVVGIGLITTLRIDSGPAQWITYPIIIGIGFGLSLAQSNNAAQTVLAKRDVASGITILAFAQQLGGTIFISVSQSILSNTLRSKLAAALPDLNLTTLASTGATEIRNLVPEDKLPVVLEAYNTGINNIFYCALGLASMAFVASLFVEWRDVRNVSGEKGGSATLDEEAKVEVKW